jgi:hypothetical protein
MGRFYQMNTGKQNWIALSNPDCTTLHCAVCKKAFDLYYSTADHHPRICPVCGIECAFLNWKGRSVQIVMDNAPRPLAMWIRWAQKHLDELEYVELICALEEISDALNEASTEPVQSWK